MIDRTFEDRFSLYQSIPLVKVQDHERFPLSAFQHNYHVIRHLLTILEDFTGLHSEAGMISGSQILITNAIQTLIHMPP
jgi:hypothetical protein